MESLIKQVCVAILVLFCGVVHSAEPASRHSTSVQMTAAQKTYIKSEEIASAKGGYLLQIEGVGKFVIRSVQTTQKPESKGKARSCLIDRAALQKEIANAFKIADRGNSKGETTKEIKLKGTMQGEQMVCTSGGSNCTVIVTQPDCDYDPDSAVLPCS